MKKFITKILLFITILFIGTTNVYASKSCDEIGSLVATSDFGSNLSIGMYSAKEHGDGSGHYSYYYQTYALSGNGNKYVAFCREAGLNSGKDLGTSFRCKDEVSESLSSDLNAAFNAGVIAIIDNGYGNKGSDAASYIATNVALRVYDMIWPGKFKGDARSNPSKYGKDPLALADMHRSLFQLYMKDSDITGYIDSINSNHSSWGLKKNISQGEEENAFYQWTNSNDSINTTAKDLLKIGLKAASEHKNEGNASIDWGTPIESTSSTLDGKNENKKTVRYTLTLKDFDLDKIGQKGGPTFKLSFDCEDCKAKGVKYEVFIDKENHPDAVFTSENTTKEFEIFKEGNDYITKDKEKISIEIVFTPDEKSDECEDVSYDFTYEYPETGGDTDVYIFEGEGCHSASANDCQDFYVYINDADYDDGSDGDEDKTKIDHKSDTVNLCNVQDCDTLDKLCREEDHNNPNGTYCKKLELNCSQCNAHVTRTVCSKDPEQMDIIEGVESENVCIEKTEEDTNVFKCIVSKDATAKDNLYDKKDIAGNTYTANASVNISSNNPYCSVACKENYHINLPGIKDSQVGRWFTLDADIQGNRTCYTSNIRRGNKNNPLVSDGTSTGKAQEGYFEYDYEKAREELVKAYNWLDFYKEAQSKIGTVTGTLKTGKSHTGHYENDTYTHVNDDGSTTVLTCPSTQNTSDSEITSGCGTWYPYDAAVSYYNYKKTFTLTNVYEWDNNHRNTQTLYSGASEFSFSATSTSDSKISLKIECTNGRSCTYTSDGYTTDGDDGNQKVNHDANSWSGVSNPSSYLSSKISEYEAKVSQAKTKLENIKKLYNECTDWVNAVDYKFGPEIDFDYSESYILAPNTIKALLPSSPIGNASKNSQACSSEVSDKYECSSGWIGATEEEPFSKLLCTNTECHIETVQIRKAKNVKVTMENEAHYITPIQFYNNYPSGGITTDNNPDNTSAELLTTVNDRGETVGVWPIGLGTAKGQYSYSLNIRNLGQYNDTGALGRIWGGAGNTVVSTADKDTCYATEGGKNWDGEGYHCAYDVDCPECPPVCEPPCEWDPPCDPPNCPPVCEDCVWGGVEFNHIPTGDINPNGDRTMGLNWYDGDDPTTFLELKAYATITEIEQANEDIYDVTFDTGSDSDFDATYAMTIELDSKVKNAIKAYNDENAEYGYANNSLSCYDYHHSSGDYKNIFCYSDLIDRLVDNFPENIQMTKYRPRTDAERDNTQDSGYWTTWDGATSTNWTITTTRLLESQRTYKETGIGPSWK